MIPETLLHLINISIILEKSNNNKHNKSNNNNTKQKYIYFINHIINIYYFIFTSLDISPECSLDLSDGSEQLKRTGPAMDHPEQEPLNYTSF
jgi:hypothetical protein